MVGASRSPPSTTTLSDTRLPSELSTVVARPGPIVVRRDNQFASDWSRDGRTVVFTDVSEATGADIWSVELEGGEPRRVVSTPYYEAGGRLSPDGRWIAYHSNETGPRPRSVLTVVSRSGEEKGRDFPNRAGVIRRSARRRKGALLLARRGARCGIAGCRYFLESTGRHRSGGAVQAPLRGRDAPQLRRIPRCERFAIVTSPGVQSGQSSW